ncbi:MAG: menaquinone biosynthesis protein [Candidatus Pristimantibacillus sp.]
MNNNFNSPLSVGRIDYTNAWPLYHHLESYTEHAGIEVISRVPSELNRMLQEGELQVSAISSFSYGLHCNQYVLLPDLSVGSEGNVNSILLFLKEPMEVARPKRIAVTTASATSVNLLKILMAYYFEHNPIYEPAEPDIDQMLESADGALLIGDPAIAASWTDRGLHVIDLGGLWNKWTGLAMTYAVVAARKEAVAAQPNRIRALHHAFLASKQQSLAELTPIINKACIQLGGDSSYWQMYFTSLQYDFGHKQREGLSLYFRYAKQLGLLEHEVNLTYYNEDQSAE